RKRWRSRMSIPYVKRWWPVSTPAAPSLIFNRNQQRKCMSKPENTAGLAGVTAGKTAICTVGKMGVGLTYRGYTIEELAAKAQFEEVAYLMLYGDLPSKQQLADYKARLRGMRGLPEQVKTVLEMLPADISPMDVLRTGASVLGCIEPEDEAREHQHDIADRLLASFPSMLLYW